MGLNQIELLSIEDTKRKRISSTGVSRLSLIIIVFQRLCANWGQRNNLRDFIFKHII